MAAQTDDYCNKTLPLSVSSSHIFSSPSEAPTPYVVAYSACYASVEGRITNYDCNRNRRNSEALGKIAGLQHVLQKLSKQQGNEGTQGKSSFILSCTEVL